MKKQVVFQVALAGMVDSYKAGDKVWLPTALADAYCADGRAKPADDDPADLKKEIAALTDRLKAVEPKPAK